MEWGGRVGVSCLRTRHDGSNGACSAVCGCSCGLEAALHSGCIRGCVGLHRVRGGVGVASGYAAVTGVCSAFSSCCMCGMARYVTWYAVSTLAPVLRLKANLHGRQRLASHAPSLCCKRCDYYYWMLRGHPGVRVCVHYIKYVCSIRNGCNIKLRYAEHTHHTIAWRVWAVRCLLRSPAYAKCMRMQGQQDYKFVDGQHAKFCWRSELG